jgi:adenylate cyclase
MKGGFWVNLGAKARCWVPPMTATRRLTAILAADVAGYSRLMGADEEGTHARLQAHLRELIEPKIAEHRGRVVKNTGDGFLAEFSSVVDAVRCAVEVQRGMAERNAETPEDKRITFRIGVNLGDVIVEEHDIFGDGVNVAARLEALAQPGGISVSRVVRDQVRDKVPFAFEDLGEQQFKNIARPVRVYALPPEVVEMSPASRAPLAASSSGSARAPRLSIMVLPFSNLSSDPEQGYFADGITDDLTTDLSRIVGLVVISRNTAFTYRDKAIDAKRIGRELHVRYVLEGSVRRSSSQVRVNAQLIDAETNAHQWAERFEHGIGDLFAVQDEITRRIAVALNLELMAAEARRSLDHPDALDCILRARAALRTPPSPINYLQAIELLEHALALDSGSVEAQCLCANARAGRVLDGMSSSATEDIARADQLVRQALSASPRSTLAHFARGEVFRAQGRPQEAIPEYETAIAFNRNWVNAIAALAWCKFFVGSLAEVIPLHEQVIQLSPRDPEIGPWYFRIGRVHLVQSRTEEAIVWFEKATRANPDHPLIHAHLASAYALSGEPGLAVAELAEARRLSGDDRYMSMTRLKAAGYWGLPKVQALFEASFFTGLRKAGMPEE